MTKLDSRGLSVSTDNATALEHYEQALGLLAGFYKDPLAEIDHALAAQPDFVMGHCFRGALFLVSSEKGAEPELRRSVEAAEALASRANDRERRHVAAMRAWLDGEFQRSSDLYNEIVIDHPRDLLALFVGHQTDFLLGQSVQLRDRIGRVMTAWDEGVPGFGFVLGMYAFGLEETNQFRRAEETGRHALALNSRDPWAVHAVAHVMEMEGRQTEGIHWMRSRETDWAADNMFAYHNWWHLALYHLDLGETDRVLALYDKAIRPAPTAVAMETLDATALLWRLQLRGVDVGAHWTDLADTWEPMADDAYYAFNDMHAMMSFMADGRGMAAQRLVTALERRAAGNGTNAIITRDVGLPVCRAIKAFAEGHYGDAATLLLRVRPFANRIGGSNAQRDVLSLTLLEAALRGKNAALARALASERTEQKPTSLFNWASTSRALELVGESDSAARARARAMSAAA